MDPVVQSIVDQVTAGNGDNQDLFVGLGGDDGNVPDLADDAYEEGPPPREYTQAELDEMDRLSKILQAWRSTKPRPNQKGILAKLSPQTRARLMNANLDTMTLEEMRALRKDIKSSLGGTKELAEKAYNLSVVQLEQVLLNRGHLCGGFALQASTLNPDIADIYDEFWAEKAAGVGIELPWPLRFLFIMGSVFTGVCAANSMKSQQQKNNTNQTPQPSNADIVMSKTRTPGELAQISRDITNLPK